MRKLPVVLTAIVCALVLTSCSLVTRITDSARERMDSRMEQIVDAINSQDAAALKAMFSPHALEQVTDINSGLDHLLSFFPDGVDTWEIHKFQEEGRSSAGKKTELLLAYYALTVGGSEYWFFFADFTVNEVTNPSNVGIYAMGAEPWAEYPHTGSEEEFMTWAASIRYDESDENGYPGIYVAE
jgi:hypothetical protein